MTKREKKQARKRTWQQHWINREDGRAIAESFLREYTLKHRFFTRDEDLRSELLDDESGDVCELWVLSFFRAVLDDAGGILVIFLTGNEVNREVYDPKTCANECIEALKKAHPKVFQYPVQVLIERRQS